MAIHIPTYFPPDKHEATDEQLEAYLALSKAGLHYAVAYQNLIGFFRMLSPKRHRTMREAEVIYQKAKERYHKSLERRSK